jgi:hypothetical protein
VLSFVRHRGKGERDADEFFHTSTTRNQACLSFFGEAAMKARKTLLACAAAGLLLGLTSCSDDAQSACEDGVKRMCSRDAICSTQTQAACEQAKSLLYCPKGVIERMQESCDKQKKKLDATEWDRCTQYYEDTDCKNLRTAPTCIFRPECK